MTEETLEVTGTKVLVSMGTSSSMAVQNVSTKKVRFGLSAATAEGGFIYPGETRILDHDIYVWSGFKLGSPRLYIIRN